MRMNDKHGMQQTQQASNEEQQKQQFFSNQASSVDSFAYLTIFMSRCPCCGIWSIWRPRSGSRGHGEWQNENGAFFEYCVIMLDFRKMALYEQDIRGPTQKGFWNLKSSIIVSNGSDSMHHDTM